MDPDMLAMLHKFRVSVPLTILDDVDCKRLLHSTTVAEEEMGDTIQSEQLLKIK